MSHLMSRSINLYNQLAKNKLFSKSVNFNLKRIKLVLKKLDHPEKKISNVINMGVKCAVERGAPASYEGAMEGEISHYEPSPYYLYARSSVSKRGIILVNSVGIIDSGYRGPLMAAFYNTKKEPVTIESGDRIVQICMPDLSYNFSVTLVDNLDETERGEGGLGSTGE